MVKAQKWLDENYPKEERDSIKTLEWDGWTANEKIEGSLDLVDFTNLEKLAVKVNDITDINFSGIKLEELYCQVNKITELDLAIFTKLKELRCENNKLVNLNLSNHLELKEISCWGNNLNNLVLINCPEITNFNCSNNQLNDLGFLNNLNAEKLTELNIGKNNFTDSLNSLSKFSNLEKLNLSDNHFKGSLEPLQNMTKLEELVIDNTDLDSGLEYLPKSLKVFTCYNQKNPTAKVGKIYEELFLYGWRIKNWKEAYPELVKAGKETISSKKQTSDSYPSLTLISTIPAHIPPQLINKEEETLEEDCNFDQINYRDFSLRDRRPFSWENEQNKSLLEELPIKLYNVQKDQTEEMNTNSNIKNYAILSYVWGKPGKADDNVFDTQYKNQLNPAGYKSLYKAIQTCKYLGINYLWMDQLCIDQTSTEEKNQEVPKMRQYYGNAEVTLIVINAKGNSKKTLKKEFAIEILKKIISSEWFSRSWTFQEGWLSKQTIFMFDDCLIDGRMLAQVLAFLSDPEYYHGLNEEPQCFATPIGWVYSKYGYEQKDKISLRLNEALRIIKNRKRSVPIDGIYSVLGLLPYGHKVVARYKEWGHKYTEEELQEALLDVIRESVKASYGEPLAWFGSGSKIPEKCWLPKIDENGSIDVKGIINIECSSEKIFLENGSLKIIGSEYKIIEINDSDGRSRDPLIDGGCYGKKVSVVDEDGKNIDNLTLLGTKETIEKINKGNILIIPNQEQWESDEPFAILATKKHGSYQRIDLVKLFITEDESEIVFKENYSEIKKQLDKGRIKNIELEKEIIIGIDDSQKSEVKNQQAQIQINPHSLK